MSDDLSSLPTSELVKLTTEINAALHARGYRLRRLPEDEWQTDWAGNPPYYLLSLI